MPLRAVAGGTEFAGEVSGDGVAVLLAHGLTATRRYVVMGSRALQRSGHRVIAYDARGHGLSAAAADGDYGYASLAADMGAVLDAAGAERAVIAGASMGAQSAVRFALEHPDRVAALVLITPAFDPASSGGEQELAGWDRLARGLREGGVEGFVAAYDLDRLAPELRPTIETVLRQRLAAHAHPQAVADALEAVPRSRPFETPSELSTLELPVTIVASRDGADPGHPLAVGEAWSRWIRGARLVVEEETSPPRSPIAWQGGQLSRVIAEAAADART